MKAVKSRAILRLAGIWMSGAVSIALGAPFTINVNYQGGMTSSQQSTFVTAANTWMGFLPQYQSGITIPQLTIDARGEVIDGPNGILGSAGWTSATNQGGYFLATRGSMRFDSADLDQLEANGTLLSVVLHEMAHVMGFGTLWSLNNVYADGSGQFTGINALTAYRNEFNQHLALFVPVELEGGNGTANSHWDEVYQGAGATGRVSINGDMMNELMTGWLNPGSFISQTTVASFYDIGYSSVPEPGTLLLMGCGLGALGIWRKRRQA